MENLPVTDNGNVKRNLRPFFYPRSIAVIGATNKKEKVGHIIFSRLKSSGARLFPVHPREKEILGVPAYPSVADLTEKIDLAIVTIHAVQTVPVVEQCAKQGIPAVIIVAGGFGETGSEGRSLEKDLVRIHNQYGIEILGPNSLGVFLPETGLDTIFVEHGDKSLSQGGSIAFITQSGSVGTESLGLASNAGYGMRAFVGLGNKIVLNETDFLDYFGRDDTVNCLAFYAESIDDGKVFLEKARKISKDKAIIVLKAGRTDAGQSAVSSHTGKLAGSDRVVNGAFHQYGVQRAFDEEEICDASRALSMLPAARGNRVAIITAAGGYGVMCTDYVEQKYPRSTLKMARLSDATQAKIKEINLPFASWHNPVDITASADDGMYAGTLDALLNDDGVDIVICIVFFSPPAATEKLVDLIAERAAVRQKPVVVFTQYGPYTDRMLKRFYDKGVVGYSSIYRTVRAVRFLVERSQIIRNLGGGQ